MRFFAQIVAILLSLLALSACETAEETTATYQAWCKVQQCNGLTQAEWERLRYAGLLPGKNAGSQSSAVLAGVIAGNLAATTVARPRK